MRARSVVLWTSVILVALTATSAVADDRPFSLAVTAQRFEAAGLADGTQDDIALGVEGAYRLGDRWRFAARLANATLSGTDPRIACVLIAPNCAEYDADVWSAEISARYAFWHRGPVEVYALAGIGWTQLDFDLLGLSQTEDAFTQHVGLGAEIDLGARLFVRPEVRRRFADSPAFEVLGLDTKVDLDQDVEASLAFGFRI